MKKSPICFVALLFLYFFSSEGMVNAQNSTIVNFDAITNGSTPYGDLISDGTFLYGTTYAGGTYDYGTLFKILPDGSGYVNLLTFDGSGNGSHPMGALLLMGGYLYGMTVDGGAYSMGTIFKILPDGTGYVNLLNFDGTIQGSSPRASLITDGTFLYGMTFYGGQYTYGTVFKILPDGTNFTVLLNFGGSNGKNPQGGLFSDGTFLYGMTSAGGTYDLGVLFKILPDGTGYANLQNFQGVTNGYAPYSEVISYGGYLYGMTGYGGANDMGCLFKVMPDGTGFVDLLDFNGSNGATPSGNLTVNGNVLYGMTAGGGLYGMGNLFRIMPDGTGYASLLTFNDTTTGSYPNSSLFSDGNFFYATTSYGGTSALGTIIKQCIPPPIIAATTDTLICSGNSITLTGGGGDLYTWTGGVTNGIGFVPPLGSTTYTVTGTVSATGCMNTDTVNISSIPCTDIYGHVTYSGGDVNNGLALIYPYDTAYAAFDTLQMQPLDATGNYHFTNVLQGDYLIKIFNDTIAFPTITSTYYGNQWVWDSALVLTHNALVNDTADVQMIELNLGGGFGLFHGYVIEGFGFGRAAGDPIEGVSVKLGIAGTVQLVASTTTDVNGQYSFNNQAYGNYTIYVDIPGIQRDSSYTFTADSANYQFLCFDYIVDSVAILAIPCDVGGTNTPLTEQVNLNIFPNPFKGNATIEYSISSNAHIALELYNMMGLKVRSLVNEAQASGIHQYSLNTQSNDLRSGVYFISLAVNGKRSIRRIVVME